MFYGKVWAIFLIVSAARLLQDTTALKCWQCASDSSKSEFCGRNLDTKNLSDERRQESYVECKTPHNFLRFNSKGEEVVHKCEVYKQIKNNYEEVYIRGCTLESRNAVADQCLSDYSDTSYVKTVQCRTCSSSDGCNEMMDNASIGVKISKVVVVSLIILTVLLV